MISAVFGSVQYPSQCCSVLTNIETSPFLGVEICYDDSLSINTLRTGDADLRFLHYNCATSSVHYTTSCNTQSSAPEDGKNNFPKHVELTGIIINKTLLLHLVGCLCYLYQWCTVKQISDNEIYLLIKYIKSVLWRVAICLSLYRGSAVPKG